MEYRVRKKLESRGIFHVNAPTGHLFPAVYHDGWKVNGRLAQEGKVYFALLGNRRITVYDLAGIINLPGQKILLSVGTDVKVESLDNPELSKVLPIIGVSRKEFKFFEKQGCRFVLIKRLIVSPEKFDKLRETPAVKMKVSMDGSTKVMLVPLREVLKIFVVRRDEK
jgi:hypothetical protein